MYNKVRKTEKGFTLIELLVVISIIALLSVVVISSMEEARNKARNSAKNSLVKQYLSALELYRNSEGKGSYPTPSDPAATVCLGDYGAEGCYGPRETDTTLVNKIEPYIKGAPADTNPIPLGPYDWRGVTYKCKTEECNDYTLNWVLLGGDSRCIEGVDPLEFGDTNFYCKYDSSKKLRTNDES